MLLFALASLICALAQSIEWLWLGRALQGVSGGAGFVVGRAVVRDLYDGAQAQRLMARVMMIFAIAPAIAPVIGGVLLTLAGGRSIFVFLACYGALVAWLVWRTLPETLPVEARQSLHPGSLARAAWQMMRCLPFMLLIIAQALSFNGFFIYVLAAPVFVIEHLGLAPTAFFWLFGPAVVGVVGGSMLSGRLAGVLRPSHCIALGFAIMLLAAALNLFHSVWMRPGVPGSVLPIMVYTFGMTVAMPALSLLALDLFPHRRGLASSSQSLVQVGINALSAGLLVPLLWVSTVSLAGGMALFLCASLVAFVWWGAVARR